MGVPEQDRPKMHEWTAKILSSAQGAERSEQAKTQMCAYLGERLRACRGARGEDGGADGVGDVIGMLAGAVAADEVTEEEAVGLALLLQIGGEAVTNNVGNMVYVLLTRPDLMDELRASPALRPTAINELLRYIPHRNSVGLSRIALEDVEVAYQVIRAA